MIKNTFDWYNGEIFEGKFILGFGLFLIAIAFLFYLYGNLPSAKVLLFPLLVIGIFFTAIGVGSIYSNSKKVAQIELKFNENQEQFIQSEIKRVEDFQYLYPMSIGISLFCFAVALGLLYFVKNIHWQAIAIALILLGSAFAIIDYFSKERATIYYEKLTHFKS